MTADLSALIARLEAAEVGSRELDYAIKAWLEPIDEFWALRVAADWTTSLDSAIALAERVVPGAEIWIGRIDGQWEADCEPVGCEKHSRFVDHKGRTPALALCTAILRAKAQEG